MNRGKDSHYRNHNVWSDVDFIAKSNVSLGTGSAKKGLEFFIADRLLEVQ